MIYNVTFIKFLSIVLIIYIFFEILGHTEELFYINQSAPYFEYLQNDLVRFFYVVILLLLIFYLIVLVKILIMPSHRQFQKSTTVTVLFISLLLILFVYLKNTFTVSIETESYLFDKSIKGMAHFLGYIPTLVFLIYALILFLVKMKQSQTYKPTKLNK